MRLQQERQEHPGARVRIRQPKLAAAKWAVPGAGERDAAGAFSATAAVAARSLAGRSSVENVRLAAQAQLGHSFRFFAPAAKGVLEPIERAIVNGGSGRSALEALRVAVAADTSLAEHRPVAVND